MEQGLYVQAPTKLIFQLDVTFNFLYLSSTILADTIPVGTAIIP